MAACVDHMPEYNSVRRWFSKINKKKHVIKRQKRRNFLVEAVLTNQLQFLGKLKTEMRHKQQERLLRWKIIQTRQAAERQAMESKIIEEINEEFREFDDFLAQLKQVKVPVQR